MPYRDLLDAVVLHWRRQMTSGSANFSLYRITDIGVVLTWKASIDLEEIHSCLYGGIPGIFCFSLSSTREEFKPYVHAPDC